MLNHIASASGIYLTSMIRVGLGASGGCGSTQETTRFAEDETSVNPSSAFSVPRVTVDQTAGISGYFLMMLFDW